MQTYYAGPTMPVIDPATCVIHPAQIFVAVLGTSNVTFAAMAEHCDTTILPTRSRKPRD